MILLSKTGEHYTHKGELHFIDSEGKIREKIHNKFADDNKSEKAKYHALDFESLINHLGNTMNIDFLDHSPFYYAAKLWNAYVDLQSNPLSSPESLPGV